MRYRPFGRSGIAVSAFSLSLSGEDDRRKSGDWLTLVHAALEAGVNAFELVRPSPELLTGFAEGIAAVRRTLLFVSLRADSSIEPSKLDKWAGEIISAAALGELNLFTIDADAPDFDESLGAGLRLKDLELVRRLGAAGLGEQLTEHVEDPLFDALIMPFGMQSGWRDRNLVRTALERQMAVIAYDPCPPELTAMATEDRKQAKGGWFKRANPIAAAGTHAFLHTTPGWSAEQIALAHALTEPAIASVQMPAKDADHLQSLAEVTDRNLPSQISAQIEMAHFGVQRTARTRAEDKRRA